MPTDRVYPPSRYARPAHPAIDPRIAQAWYDAPGTAPPGAPVPLSRGLTLILLRMVERTPVLAFDGVTWQRGDVNHYPMAVAAHPDLIGWLHDAMLRNLTLAMRDALQGADALVGDGIGAARYLLDLRGIARMAVADAFTRMAQHTPTAATSPGSSMGDASARLPLCDGWALSIGEDTPAQEFAWSEVYAAMRVTAQGTPGALMRGTASTVDVWNNYRRECARYGYTSVPGDTEAARSAAWRYLRTERGWSAPVNIRGQAVQRPPEHVVRLTYAAHGSKSPAVTDSPHRNEDAPVTVETHGFDAATDQDIGWFAWAGRKHFSERRHTP